MDRIRCMVLVLFALLAACPAVAAERSAPGQALVVLKNGLKGPLTQEALLSVEGRVYVAGVALGAEARVVEVYDGLSVAGGTIFALFASDRHTTEELIAALKKRPEVLAVSSNREVRTMGSADVRPKAAVKPKEKPQKGAGTASGDKRPPAAKAKPEKPKAQAPRPKTDKPKAPKQ